MTEAELVAEIEGELRDDDKTPVAPPPTAEAGDPGDEQESPAPTEAA